MLLLPPFTSGRLELIFEMFFVQAETVNSRINPEGLCSRAVINSREVQSVLCSFLDVLKWF